MNIQNLIRKFLKPKAAHVPQPVYVPPLPRFKLFLRDRDFLRFADSFTLTVGRFVKTLFDCCPDLNAVAIGIRPGEVTVLTFDYSLPPAAREVLEYERPLGVRIEYNPAVHKENSEG